MSKKSIHRQFAALADGDTNLPLRIDASDLKSMIAERVFYRPDGDHSTVTICKLHLISGFVVIGTSGCVHPDAFSQVLGEKAAYENALDQLWNLEGYRLRHALAEDQLYYRKVKGTALTPLRVKVSGDASFVAYTPLSNLTPTAPAPAPTFGSLLTRLRRLVRNLIPTTKLA